MLRRFVWPLLARRSAIGLAFCSSVWGIGGFVRIPIGEGGRSRSSRHFETEAGIMIGAAPGGSVEVDNEY